MLAGGDYPPISSLRVFHKGIDRYRFCRFDSTIDLVRFCQFFVVVWNLRGLTCPVPGVAWS